MTTSRSQDQLSPLPMDDEPAMDRGLPVVLRRRHRWVSRMTDRKIEEAWWPKESRQTCQVCQEERPSHRELRLHVEAHFLLHFCPCRFHDVYPYPVIVHKMDCFAGEGHVVDTDCFPQYLDTIRPVIKKALTLAALTSGFQTLLTAARQQSPMVTTPPATPVTSNDTPIEDGTTMIPTKEKTPRWLVNIPKAHCSEGPLFRRCIGPKVHYSQGALVQKLVDIVLYHWEYHKFHSQSCYNY